MFLTVLYFVLNSWLQRNVWKHHIPTGVREPRGPSGDPSSVYELKLSRPTVDVFHAILVSVHRSVQVRM